MAGKFIVKCVAENEYTFDLLDEAGETLITGTEVYMTADQCRDAVLEVKANADAHLEDRTRGEIDTPLPKYELYLDKLGGFRFRLWLKGRRVLLKSRSFYQKDKAMELYTRAAAAIAATDEIEMPA